MDTEWGWRGCWENRGTICGWLAENAKRMLGKDVEPTLQDLARLALDTAKERNVTVDEELAEQVGKLVEENEDAAWVFQQLLGELEPLLEEALTLLPTPTWG